MHPPTTNQQQQLATGSTKWKSGERRVLDVEHGSFTSPGLLNEWRLGPFCHSHIQKAGQPNLQLGVTTLQCNSWLYQLQDCILTDRLGCDVPTWDQILNPQPLRGLESPQPATRRQANSKPDFDGIFCGVREALFLMLQATRQQSEDAIRGPLCRRKLRSPRISNRLARLVQRGIP